MCMNAQSLLVSNILARLVEAGHSQLITSVLDAVRYGRGSYVLETHSTPQLPVTVKSIGTEALLFLPFSTTMSESNGTQNFPKP